MGANNEDEMIDALDEHGNFIQSITRKQIHKDGYWHKTVHVWIMNRSAHKHNFPGLWDVSVAGHLCSGESSLEGALRECQEELSIEFDPNSIRYIFSCKLFNTFNDGKYIDRELVDVYLIVNDLDLAQLTLQGEEVESVMHRPWKEVKEAMSHEDSGAVPLIGDNGVNYAKFWDYIESIIE